LYTNTVFKLPPLSTAWQHGFASDINPAVLLILIKKLSAYNDAAEQPEEQEVPDDPEDSDQTDDTDEQGGLIVLRHTFLSNLHV